MKKFVAILAVLSLGYFGYAQELTAHYSVKENLFKTEARFKSTRFEVTATQEEFTNMINYTNPLYEHMKFTYEKGEGNVYRVVLMFKPEKDVNYAISALKNMGIATIVIDGESHPVEDLEALRAN